VGAISSLEMALNGDFSLITTRHDGRIGAAHVEMSLTWATARRDMPRREHSQDRIVFIDVMALRTS
jgi:hypothetical protein